MSDRSVGALLLAVALIVGFQAGFFYQGNSFSLFDGECKNERVKEVIHSYNVSDSREQLYASIFNNTKKSVVSVVPLKRTERGTEQISVGSGFVYSQEGHIVTNNHVVDEGDMFDVTFLDGSTYEAEIVGTDPYTDLAVLKVQNFNMSFKPLQLSENSDYQVGNSVLAIGKPFGLSGSMTHGIISQTGRTLPAVGRFSIHNVIQTDAAINPGNSGGPLLNVEGEMIGINTAIDTRTSTFSGVGFAIPVSTVKRVVPELIQTGSYEHPWLGVSGVDVTPPIAEEMGLDEARGFLVVNVVDGSPADKAGVESGDWNETVRGAEMTLGGDVIVGIGGRKVSQLTDVLNYLADEVEVGDTVELTVLRDGRRREIRMVLEERPEAK